MSSENLRSMLRAKLEEGQYDGLFSPSGVCCCYLVHPNQHHNCPCDDPNPDCVPGNIHTEDITIRVIGSISTGVISVEPPWEIVE